MNLLEAIKKVVLNEGLNPEFSSGMSGVDTDDSLYRSLSQNSKDLDEYKYSRVQQIVRWFAKTHPLGKRLVELTKDFVIGSGLTYESENPKVKACLDSFWYDPFNNMLLNHHTKIDQMTIFGEQALPVIVNETNGHVRLGYVSPSSIEDIITAKDNILDIRQVKVKANAGEEPKYYDIIKLNEVTGYLEGEIFYFRINNLDDEKRGYSDLIAILDWLDIFDQILMGEADRIILIKSFIYDFLCKGMSDDQISEYSKKFSVPKPGTAFFHNENIEASAIAPNLNTADSTNYLKFLLSFMLGGVGIPEHYFALAYDINRATATEMDIPLVKKIQNRQEFVRFMFSHMFDFVIDQSIIYKRQLIDRDTGKGLGSLSEKEDLTYKIVLPSPSKKDIIQMANSLQPFASSLVIAQNNDWISNATAGRAFITTINESGLEIDTQEEKEIIDGEKEIKKEQIYNVPLPIEQDDQKRNTIPGVDKRVNEPVE